MEIIVDLHFYYFPKSIIWITWIIFFDYEFRDTGTTAS